MSDYFIFDNIDTRNYEGISVYFDEVDTTPKRVGEFIEIPNRNGSLFLDSGRYEDVTHTYDIIALSFQNGRDLINALASKVGHHRLEDSFNTGEYYSAVFDTEVLPTATMERDKFSFKVMFTRKPQRFLTSGETAVTVANNGTLTNPTLFDANPMLEVTGYGEISLNGEVMAVNNEPLGQTKLSKAGNGNKITLDVSNLNTGDSIYKLEADKPQLEYGMKPKSGSFSSMEITSVASCTAYLPTKQKLIIVPDFPQIVKGTNVTVSASVGLTITLNGTTYNGFVNVALQYNGSANTIGMTIARSGMPSTTDVWYSPYYQHPAYYGDSTKLIAPTPMYLDLDIGEAYGIVNGEVVSFNNIVSLPAELPKLKAGNNTITFDNTVTDLKVVPRWWKI